MKTSIIAFTEKGFRLSERIKELLLERSHEATLSRGFGESKTDLSKWVEKSFETSGALIFIGAAGIAVRSVAPHIRSKAKDPAVIVIDEHAKFVIPILSGHLGGANELSESLAEGLGAQAVITTATDINGLFSIDDWARRQGLAVLNPTAIKSISARLLAGEIIRIKSTFPISGLPPRGVELTESEDNDVFISAENNGRDAALRMTPPVCVLGVGCRRNVPVEEIEKVFHDLILLSGLEERSIERVCSIDIKADEKGLLEFCEKHGFLFQTFPPDELSQVYGNFSASEFVLKTTGVDNVCERSAILGGGDKAQLILKKRSLGAVTMALAIRPYTLSF